MSTNGGEGLSPRYAHQLGVPLPGVTIWGVISGEEGYLRHSDSSQPIYCISSSAERLSNKVIQRKLRHFEHWIRHVCHLSLQTDIAMGMTKGSRGKGIRRWWLVLMKPDSQTNGAGSGHFPPGTISPLDISRPPGQSPPDNPPPHYRNVGQFPPDNSPPLHKEK